MRLTEYCSVGFSAKCTKKQQKMVWAQIERERGRQGGREREGGRGGGRERKTDRQRRQTDRQRQRELLT